MNPIDWLVVFLYLMVAVVSGLTSFHEYRGANEEDKKSLARITLLAPVWPIPLAWFVLYLIWLLLSSIPGALRWVPRLWREAFSKESR